MLNRIFLSFFLFSSFVLAKSFGDKVQDIELAAKEVSKKGDLVEAKGDVFAYSKEYLLSADRALYNQATGVIELFGNVNLMKGLNATSRANYAKVDLTNSTESFDSGFLMDKDSELWMQNDEACSTETDLYSKGSIVSSCNVKNPDWSVHFSSGKINKESKFLHVFNPVFYIKKVPILYLPYFGFPLDTTRRTGLLIPKLGFSKSEGFVYRQPIYFAPQNWWDLTLSPDIRTQRGQGIFTNFRFADSPSSKGEISLGYFKDKKKYFEDKDLKYRDHKGLEIKYERNKLLSYLIDGDFKEGLWLQYTKANDVNYLNLEDGGDRDKKDDALLSSRANYFLTTDKNYFGLYAKYYQDTSKENNDYTLQDLPIFQYHRFSTPLFLDRILYSFDYKYHKYARRIGTQAKTNEFSLPLSYSQPLFGDYLNFKFEEAFYFLNANYDKFYSFVDNEYKKTKQNNYFNNYHKFTLFTDLIKSYDSFYHTAYISLDYLLPGYNRGSIDNEFLNGQKLDDYQDKNGKWPEKPSASYYDKNFLGESSREYTTRNTNASLLQYFYNNDGRKLIMHRISQGYNFKDKEATNLENKLAFYFPYGITFQNEIEYNHKYSRLQKVQNSLSYSGEKFALGLTHTYKETIKERDPLEALISKESYMTLSSSAKIFDFYRIAGKWDYDNENKYTKLWSLSLGQNKKCWNYYITYKQDYEPIMTKSGIKTNRTSGIMLEFNLYPLGGATFQSRIQKKDATLD